MDNGGLFADIGFSSGRTISCPESRPLPAPCVSKRIAIGTGACSINYTGSLKP